MSLRLFPYGHVFSYGDFELEIVEKGVSQYPHLLDQIRDDVFVVAAHARGWDDPAGLEAIRRNFKIGPLYEANGLVLIRSQGALIGLGGTVNNWHLEDKSVVHLCSLALLPQAQNRGFMQALSGLLWIINWKDETLRAHYVQQRVYVSAITQSPYVFAFLHRLFDVYPSPTRARPDPDMVDVAQQVVARFDAHVPFDAEKFILRNECNFFYKRTPYSASRHLNQFCDQNLKYDQGDVFVVVGRVIPAVIESHITIVAQRCPELFAVLCESVIPSTSLAAMFNGPVAALPRECI